MRQFHQHNKTNSLYLVFNNLEKLSHSNINKYSEPGIRESIMTALALLLVRENIGYF